MGDAGMFVIVVVGVAALFVLISVWIALRLSRRSGRLFYVARIADDLAKVADVRRGTKVQIVGFDLSCFFRTEYAWKNVLKDWLESGAEVEYVVQECEGNDCVSVKKWTHDAGLDDQLKIYKVREDSKDEELVEGCHTFHWTIFLDPDQLWIEGNHPPGTTRAYDCEYRPHASEDERFERLKDMFERLKDMFERLKAWSERVV